MQQLRYRWCFFFSLAVFLAGYTVVQQLPTRENIASNVHDIPSQNPGVNIVNNDTISNETNFQGNSSWNVVETTTDIDGKQSSAVPDLLGGPTSLRTTTPEMQETTSPPTKRGRQQGHSDIRRILVVAHKRSGSSFLSEVLASNPSTFLHFEPLHMVSQVRVASSNLPRALDVITNFFLCAFDKFPDYIEDVKKNIWLLRHNQFLWHHCASRGRVCTIPKFMSRVCSSASTQVMKLVRLDMRHVQEWLKSVDKIMGPLKVVYLVRDPRGILASRRAANFLTNGTMDYNAALFCDEMARDLEAFNQIEKEFPGRSVQVRYEDIALDPIKQAELLFRKLGLKFSNTTSAFLRLHTINGTSKDLANPFSTTRNSAVNAFIWKKRLNATDTEAIENHCRAVLVELGYL